MFKKAKPLKNPEDLDHAVNYALFVLELSARTEGEIKAKLVQRGYSSKLIPQVLSKLKEWKYLNDRAYADNFLDSCKRFKFYGRQMIRQKMKQKFLDSELIDEVLAKFSKQEELELAAHLAQKTFGENFLNAAKEDFQLRQKIMMKLARGGFNYDLIQEIFNYKRGGCKSFPLA